MGKITSSVIMFSVFLSAPLFAQENLLANSGFEEDVLEQLAMWQPDSYQDNDDARRIFPFAVYAHSGKRSLAIVNLVPNDSRVVQWLAVEPDSFYRISAWVRAEEVSGDAVAANISVLGSVAPSASVRNTGDTWEELELVGKTGPDQRYLAVALRLGFYNNLVVGRAFFDDVSMIKIPGPPAGARIVNFASNAEGGRISQENNQAAKNGTLDTLIFALIGGAVFAAAVVMIALLLIRRSRAKAKVKTATRRETAVSSRPPVSKKKRKGKSKTQTKRGRKS